MNWNEWGLLLVPLFLIATFAISNRNRGLGRPMRYPPFWVSVAVIVSGCALIALSVLL